MKRSSIVLMAAAILPPLISVIPLAIAGRNGVNSAPTAAPLFYDNHDQVIDADGPSSDTALKEIRNETINIGKVLEIVAKGVTLTVKINSELQENAKLVVKSNNPTELKSYITPSQLLFENNKHQGKVYVELEVPTTFSTLSLDFAASEAHLNWQNQTFKADRLQMRVAASSAHLDATTIETKHLKLQVDAGSFTGNIGRLKVETEEVAVNSGDAKWHVADQTFLGGAAGLLSFQCNAGKIEADFGKLVDYSLNAKANMGSAKITRNGEEQSLAGMAQKIENKAPAGSPELHLDVNMGSLTFTSKNSQN